MSRHINLHNAPKTKTDAAPRGMGRITPNANGTCTLGYFAGGKQHEETFSSNSLATDRQAEIWRKKGGMKTSGDR